MKDPKSLIGRSFVRNAFFGYGAHALKVAIGFAWVAALTAVAGLEVVGMFALLTSISGLVGNLLTFRTNEAVVKFYKKGVSEDAASLKKLALSAGLALDILVAVVLFVSVRLLAEPIATTLLKDPETMSSVTIFSWVIFANFIRGTGMGLLTAKESFRTIYSITVVEQLARLTMLLVVWKYAAEVEINTVVRVVMISALATSAFVFSLPVYRLTRLPINVVISSTEVREYLSFSFSTFVSSGLKAGNRGVDTMILGFLTNPESVGIYHLFKRFLSPLSAVVSPFHAQIYPVFVTAISSGNSRNIKLTIDDANRTILKWSILLLVPITIAIYMYWMILDLEFTAQNITTFVVVAITSIILQQLWWTRGFALSYKPAISIWENLVKSLLVVTLGFLFTWWFGLIGISVGMLVVAICTSIFWHVVIRDFSGKCDTQYET